ncbi:MAG TPA: hypothetical protein PKE04_06970 [Clostridia bacterium]|nr:hypothetical protein [Clostridia bacterium]
MKARTMAGMMVGSVVGIALGAGLMMVPQGRQMKKVLEKGATQVQRHLHDWMR